MVNILNLKNSPIDHILGEILILLTPESEPPWPKRSPTGIAKHRACLGEREKAEKILEGGVFELSLKGQG